MQDRPDARELLDAVQRFLTVHVVPQLEGTRQFHARVAANVLAIVARELTLGEDALRAERVRLHALLGSSAGSAPQTGTQLADDVRALNEALAARIRAGDADKGPWRADVLAHLRTTTAERLAIVNPKYTEPRAAD